MLTPTDGAYSGANILKYNLPLNFQRLYNHLNKHHDTQTFGCSWWPSVLSALTRLCGPHLNVRVSRISGVSRFAAKTCDVTGYDAGLSHVDEEVHCEVLSAPVFLWRPDRTGVFLSTFKSRVITSAVLCETNLKRAFLTHQSLSQLCTLVFVTAFG